MTLSWYVQVYEADADDSIERLGYRQNQEQVASCVVVLTKKCLLEMLKIITCNSISSMLSDKYTPDKAASTCTDDDVINKAKDAKYSETEKHHPQETKILTKLSLLKAVIRWF